jgi:hypothetical protein
VRDRNFPSPMASGIRARCFSIGNKNRFVVVRCGMRLRPNRGIWSAEDDERLCRHIARGGSAPRRGNVQAVKGHAATRDLKFPKIRELRRRALGSNHAP